MVAPFVGVVEIVFGALILFGFLARLAAVPLDIDISVAIATTKVPMPLEDRYRLAPRYPRPAPGGQPWTDSGKTPMMFGGNSKE